MTLMHTTKRCAIYARYSSDSQSETSIDDQVRRCQQLAMQHGLEGASATIFKDEEMSGYKAKEALARPGYKALLTAWDAGEFEVLLVDEVSRLARIGRQQLELTERLERGRVRLISANGIDTQQTQWRLLFGIQGLMAQEESRSTSFRVVRGMLGQLERGYMIAQPALGYRGERIVGDDGRSLGSRWFVDEAEAALVCDMYRRRSQGASFSQIAGALNESGVSTGRGGHIWRPAAVQRILENSIYKGEFVWNGSSYSEYKARKTGTKPQKLYFARPELRIVSDELWAAVQPQREGPRSNYGGGRNAFSGWMQCGACGALLSATSGGKSMACGTCAMHRGANVEGAPATVPTISIAALNEVVKFALSCVLSDARLDALKARLKERLTTSPERELKRLRAERDRAERGAQHLLRLIRDAEAPDAMLEREYEQARDNFKMAEQALTNTANLDEIKTSRDVSAQLKVDASGLADKLLDGQLPPERVRNVLSSLFPKFIFSGRESRFVANFEIEFASGAAVAWLSGTSVIETSRAMLRVRITGSAKRPVEWKLEAMSSDDNDQPSPTIRNSDS